MKISPFVVFFSGILAGGWSTWVFTNSMIKRAFMNLEAAGNGNWINIRFELIDNMGKIAIFLFVLTVAACIFTGVTFFRHTTQRAT